MAFEIKIDDARVRVRLDAMPDALRTRLRSIVQTLDNELLSRVQSKTPVKTGKLLASFRGHVRSTKTKVSGTVTIDKSIKGERGIGAIIEAGATVPAHEILPNVKKALAFLGSAGQVFAAVVHHPADNIPAVHMLSSSLDEMSGEIVTELEDTVRNTAAGD
jgi:hypothetical protein